MSELFAYGSLEDGDARRAVLRGFERVRGSAPFPTITPAEGGSVEGSLSPVDDWAGKDRYEGRRADPAESLYWRVEVADGVWAYVGNPEVARRCWKGVWGVAHRREDVLAAAARCDLEVLD
jgi:hypothetical protein